MPDLPAIALVGDYSGQVIAHRAIPLALEMARNDLHAGISWSWVATRGITHAARDLQAFSAVWVVPASPYENMAGALAAIQWARENRKPLLGTCGGFQHMLIEFARHVAGLTAADHAETNPGGDTLVVSRLPCSLAEKSGAVHFEAGSKLRALYGRDSAIEGYHCNYGINPAYAAVLEKAHLRFSARDDAGEIRAAELPDSIHPFFVGTLFQPERAALSGTLPALARGLVAAASS